MPRGPLSYNNWSSTHQEEELHLHLHLLLCLDPLPLQQSRQQRPWWQDLELRTSRRGGHPGGWGWSQMIRIGWVGTSFFNLHVHYWCLNGVAPTTYHSLWEHFIVIFTFLSINMFLNAYNFVSFFSWYWILLCCNPLVQQHLCTWCNW